ncbi:cytochrome c oxidase subunit 7A-related protein, mitochondrial-like [Hyposmocoma kahamanoa]|uniref:cytochrome c oxidase subunit 7A-related protein, mitochondrial-like n=1 Tax=Hyposmocoma kahamanoa TaxID=1477025 RepID=UPI000E6D84F4|nr:cytochrome c oxidase subunit 7A-related protein, mitochondrial-like [Hyposmocoma kahamanoa]
MFLISRNIAKLVLRNGRAISTTSSLRDPRSLVKLKTLQSAYQVEDGVPIYLKSGFLDRLLYSTTIVLTVVGLVNTLITIYNHARPNSWKTEAC